MTCNRLFLEMFIKKLENQGMTMGKYIRDIFITLVSIFVFLSICNAKTNDNENSIITDSISLTTKYLTCSQNC